MNALTDRINQHGTRAVEHVASRNLFASVLQQIGSRTVFILPLVLADAEYWADIEIDVKIGRTVYGVVEQTVTPDRTIFGNVIGFFHFLRSQAADKSALLEYRDKHFIGKDIHLFDGFSLHVHSPCKP